MVFLVTKKYKGNSESLCKCLDNENEYYSVFSASNGMCFNYYLLPVCQASLFSQEGNRSVCVLQMKFIDHSTKTISVLTFTFDLLFQSRYMRDLDVLCLLVAPAFSFHHLPLLKGHCSAVNCGWSSTGARRNS